MVLRRPLRGGVRAVHGGKLATDGNRARSRRGEGPCSRGGKQVAMARRSGGMDGVRPRRRRVLPRSCPAPAGHAVCGPVRGSAHRRALHSLRHALGPVRPVAALRASCRLARRLRWWGAGRRAMPLCRAAARLAGVVRPPGRWARRGSGRVDRHATARATRVHTAAQASRDASWLWQSLGTGLTALDCKHFVPILTRERPRSPVRTRPRRLAQMPQNRAWLRSCFP
jgi:hypothetical protein